MKPIIYLLLLFQPFFAPVQKSNPKNQQELQAELKNAQAEYDKLTPEQKKMMEQMGIKLPDAKSNPVLDPNNSTAVDAAMQKELAVVPARDAARIASIQAAPLTNASIAAYIETVHNKLAAKIKAESRQMGDKLFAELQSKKASPTEAGNTAIALWIAGRLQLALYLNGKVLLAEPANTDNQSNYAAMLSMSGGEQYAIPLLNKLNTQFAKNSTILNNLGQAWFGLGEINKAEKYLDSAIAIFPFHPQANFTSSFISEKNGNKTKAIEQVKRSMQYSVSNDKVNRLRKLGYKLNYDDIPLPYIADPDPLGLNDFKLPAFPANAQEEAALRKEWDTFFKNLDEKIVSVQQKLSQMQQPVIEATTKQAQAVIEQYQSTGKLSQTTNAKTSPGYSARARIKLNLLHADKAFTGRPEKLRKDIEAYRAAKKAFATEYEKAYNQLDRKQALQTGEGMANDPMCKEFIALVDDYYKKVNNDELNGMVQNYLKHLRLLLNEEVFWEQFIQTPEEFEITILKKQLQWLAAFQQAYLGYGDKIAAGYCVNTQSLKGGGRLANFNDLHCSFKGELNFPIGNIKFECGRMISSIGLGPVKFSMEQDMDKATGDGMFDDFVKCNVELKAGVSEKVRIGPLEAKVGAEGGIGMEIGRNGVEDVYLTGKISAGAGTNSISRLAQMADDKYSSQGIGISDKTLIGVSASGRMSLISGQSSIDLTANFLK